MMSILILQYYALALFIFFDIQKSVKGEDTREVSVKPQDLESIYNSKDYNKFADILKIPNTNLVDPSQRLELGDILLRPEQKLNPDQAYTFNGTYQLSINKWEKGIVPYFISNTFTIRQISSMNKYVNNVLGPNINFRPYEDTDVFIYNGDCGCYANLGKVGGPQVISLVAPCFIQGFVAHELQHALGFAHEHNRIDRDTYLTVEHENISEVLMPQYERYSQDNMLNTGPFDYCSIMMYPFMVPGLDYTALKLTQDRIDTSRLGYEKYLAPSDIKRVKTVYKEN